MNKDVGINKLSNNFVNSHDRAIVGAREGAKNLPTSKTIADNYSENVLQPFSNMVANVANACKMRIELSEQHNNLLREHSDEYVKKLNSRVNELEKTIFELVNQNEELVRCLNNMNRNISQQIGHLTTNINDSKDSIRDISGAISDLASKSDVGDLKLSVSKTLDSTNLKVKNLERHLDKINLVNRDNEVLKEKIETLMNLIEGKEHKTEEKVSRKDEKKKVTSDDKINKPEKNNKLLINKKSSKSKVDSSDYKDNDAMSEVSKSDNIYVIEMDDNLKFRKLKEDEYDEIYESGYLCTLTMKEVKLGYSYEVMDMLVKNISLKDKISKFMNNIRKNELDFQVAKKRLKKREVVFIMEYDDDNILMKSILNKENYIKKLSDIFVYTNGVYEYINYEKYRKRLQDMAEEQMKKDQSRSQSKTRSNNQYDRPRFKPNRFNNGYNNRFYNNFNNGYGNRNSYERYYKGDELRELIQGIKGLKDEFSKLSKN
jgi:hypothetical protein